MSRRSAWNTSITSGLATYGGYPHLYERPEPPRLLLSVRKPFLSCPRQKTRAQRTLCCSNGRVSRNVRFGGYSARENNGVLLQTLGAFHCFCWGILMILFSMTGILDDSFKGLSLQHASRGLEVTGAVLILGALWSFRVALLVELGAYLARQQINRKWSFVKEMNNGKYVQPPPLGTALHMFYKAVLQWSESHIVAALGVSASPIYSTSGLLIISALSIRHMLQMNVSNNPTILLSFPRLISGFFWMTTFSLRAGTFFFLIATLYAIAHHIRQRRFSAEKT